MSIKNRKSFSREQIVKAIANSETMGGAAKYLKVDWRTFRYNAESYNLYKPAAASWRKKYNLDDILNGKHSQYPSNKLARRLQKEGHIERKCGECGIDEWRGRPISFELNHKDGDNSNHKLENLELLCPNCHSQTETFRNKRGKRRAMQPGTLRHS